MAGGGAPWGVGPSGAPGEGPGGGADGGAPSEGCLPARRLGLGGSSRSAECYRKSPARPGRDHLAPESRGGRTRRAEPGARSGGWASPGGDGVRGSGEVQEWEPESERAAQEWPERAGGVSVRRRRSERSRSGRGLTGGRRGRVARGGTGAGALRLRVS